jgi:hypothetical protein
MDNAVRAPAEHGETMPRSDDCAFADSAATIRSKNAGSSAEWPLLGATQRQPFLMPPGTRATNLLHREGAGTDPDDNGRLLAWGRGPKPESAACGCDKSSERHADAVEEPFPPEEDPGASTEPRNRLRWLSDDFKGITPCPGKSRTCMLELLAPLPDTELPASLLMISFVAREDPVRDAIGVSSIPGASTLIDAGMLSDEDEPPRPDACNGAGATQSPVATHHTRATPEVPL